jgi:hypothetical protein
VELQNEPTTASFVGGVPGIERIAGLTTVAEGPDSGCEMHKPQSAVRLGRAIYLFVNPGAESFIILFRVRGSIPNGTALEHAGVEFIAGRTPAKVASDRQTKIGEAEGLLLQAAARLILRSEANFGPHLGEGADGAALSVHFDGAAALPGQPDICPSDLRRRLNR